MNPLAIISKSLREMENAYGKIKTEETRGKADSAIDGVMGRIRPVAAPVANSEASTATISINGGVVWLKPPEPFKSDSVGSETVGLPVVVGSVTTSSCGGTTTVYPADYKSVVEEYAVEGDIGGTGTFYPETVTSAPPEPTVEFIGGWPERSTIKVLGLFPNRRSLRGVLPDGRSVHVERRMEWKTGEIKGRLVRAGAAPLYRTL